MIFLFADLWPSSNDTILLSFCHNVPFCHIFVTIYDETKKLYNNNELNRGIEKYYNGTKNVIAVTELIDVFFNSVEASFQIIILFM